MPAEAPTHDVSVDRDVEHRTRDGVVLRADIYRPEGIDGPLPVLLTRTPYNKAMPLTAGNARAIAALGYIVVGEDIRGTHGSDGDYVWVWDPASQQREGEDGYDSVEWAARLPGSDGRVGTFGVSYMSHCQWALAKERPPSLKAMHVGGKAFDSRDMTFGIFDTGRRLQWSYAQAADQRRRLGHTDGPLSREEANQEWLRSLQGKWIWHLPLADLPDYVLSSLTGPYREFLPNQHRNILSFEGIHEALDIPVCSVTGWWDRISSCVRHHELLQAVGRAEYRSLHRLIIGPWSHDPSSARRNIGPRDYGPDADYPYPQQVADWFDHVFKGRHAPRLSDPPPVRLFIVNDNRWHGFQSWPPEAATPVPYYFHSGGDARSAYGDGLLSPEPPDEEPPDHYVYDPSDPFMSTMNADSHYAPVDQRITGYRRDNLVFQTPPLAEDLTIAGVITCRLWAASDAPDTDFSVRLVEVGADGLALNITQGIVRARYRDGFDRPAMLEPGRPTLFEIRLLPAGIRFTRGSRIRIDVASSDFPAFDRNHNTGADFWSDAELRPARQTVFHDAARPSHVILPVLRDFDGAAR